MTDMRWVKSELAKLKIPSKLDREIVEGLIDMAYALGGREEILSHLKETEKLLKGFAWKKK
jgi:hypothetical protein